MEVSPPSVPGARCSKSAPKVLQRCFKGHCLHFYTMPTALPKWSCVWHNAYGSSQLLPKHFVIEVDTTNKQQERGIIIAPTSVSWKMRNSEIKPFPRDLTGSLWQILIQWCERGISSIPSNFSSIPTREAEGHPQAVHLSCSSCYLSWEHSWENPQGKAQPGFGPVHTPCSAQLLSQYSLRHPQQMTALTKLK